MLGGCDPLDSSCPQEMHQQRRVYSVYIYIQVLLLLSCYQPAADTRMIGALCSGCGRARSKGWCLFLEVLTCPAALGRWRVLLLQHTFEYTLYSVRSTSILLRSSIYILRSISYVLLVPTLATRVVIIFFEVLIASCSDILRRPVPVVMTCTYTSSSIMMASIKLKANHKCTGTTHARV